MDLGLESATDIDSEDIGSIIKHACPSSRDSSVTTVTGFERGVDALEIPHLPAHTLGLSQPSNGTQVQSPVDE
jgi:hypothetical protein